MRETWVRCLGGEDPLEKEMATHSSVLPWKTPWMVCKHCRAGHCRSSTDFRSSSEKSTQELKERRKTLLLQCLSSTSYWQSLLSCQLTKEKHLEGETNPETRPGLVCSICIMYYYHEFSNLNNTHVLSHSFCKLGVWHILSRFSAQGLTRLKSKCQLAASSSGGLWNKQSFRVFP